MKKLCIFDFDGTILNTMPEVSKCFEKALIQSGFPALTQKEYEEAVGGIMEECISKILKDQNTPENIKIVKKAYDNNYYGDKNDLSEAYPGVHEMLQHLQEKNIKLAINSNRKTENIKKYNKKFIDDIQFDEIRGYNPQLPPKPNPINLLKIIENLGVTKEETVYIGDTITDIETANNAQVDCIIVSWGQGKKEDLINNSILKIINKPSEIYELIGWELL